MVKKLTVKHFFLSFLAVEGGAEKKQKAQESIARPRGEGQRQSITKLGLLINKEIKDILIKDIFPCLSNASAATMHIIFKC